MSRRQDLDTCSQLWTTTTHLGPLRLATSCLQNSRQHSEGLAAFFKSYHRWHEKLLQDCLFPSSVMSIVLRDLF